MVKGPMSFEVPKNKERLDSQLPKNKLRCMIRTQIYLTEQEHAGISRLANNLEKKQSELIRQAIDEFLVRSNPADKLKKIREARGIWKDRDDFELKCIRADFDRF